MYVARVAPQDGSHPSLAQPARVRLALVAQGIEAGAHDQRRCRGAEVLGQQRRCARVMPVAARPEELLLVPVDVLFGEDEALGEGQARLGDLGEAGDRIDEQLEGRGGTAVGD